MALTSISNKPTPKKRRGGAPKKHKSRKIPPSKIINNPNWRCIATLNEKPKVAKKLREKEWDFSHLRGILETLEGQHPDSDFFLIGTAPFFYGEPGNVEEMCPTLGVLKAPRGETPPEFVQVVDLENDTKEIVHFSDFGLAWKPFEPRKSRAFALKPVHGNMDAKCLERAKLWNMVGKALDRKENGELDIKIAKFEYLKPNGEWIWESYSKGMSTYSEICWRHDLTMVDEDTGDTVIDPDLMSGLKIAIKNGFEAARNHQEGQITMLTKSHPSFASIQGIAKVFPIVQPPPEGDIGYINEFYGKAVQIFADRMI